MNINIQIETRDGVARVAQIGTWTDPGEDMITGKAIVNTVWSAASALVATLQGLIEPKPELKPEPETKPELKPEPAPAPTPTPTPEPELSMEDVRKALIEVKKTKGAEGLKACFDKVGAAKLTDVDPKDYATMYATAKEVLNAK